MEYQEQTQCSDKERGRLYSDAGTHFNFWGNYLIDSKNHSGKSKNFGI